MNTRLMTIVASALISSLLFSVYQPGAAAPYYNHDGSVDSDLVKKIVKPLKGHANYWLYSIETCATDHAMRVSLVILKSDIDEKKLGVNKIIPKGECRSYGAVMKAKDPNTLGASLLESYEAVEKMGQLLRDKASMSKEDRKIAHHQIIELFVATEVMPR